MTATPQPLEASSPIILMWDDGREIDGWVAFVHDPAATIGFRAHPMVYAKWNDGEHGGAFAGIPIERYCSTVLHWSEREDGWGVQPFYRYPDEIVPEQWQTPWLMSACASASEDAP